MKARTHIGTNPEARAWVLVAIVALIWVFLYRSLVPFWHWFVFELVGLDESTRLAEAVHFFFYDTSKILLLLSGIIFLITVLRSFFSVERTRALLGGKREGVGNMLAASLGVVTPFCSCSAVPAFIGFVAAGVPLGVTLSFLIASPLVNEIALVMLFGLFGWQIAALYLAAGMVLAVSAGFVLGKLKLERFVEPFVFETKLDGRIIDLAQGLTWDERFVMAWQEVVTITAKIWPYLLLGIAAGAAIHGWVPESFFVRFAGPDQPLAVPFAVLLGIPLYSNAAGIMPLVEALHDKGLAMGTLLSFMMAVVALSLPEMIILRRVLKPKLIAVFMLIVAAGILMVGFLFNLIL